MATNAEVAAAFEELAVLSEILGANVFKVNAFRKAARAVEALARSAVEMPVAELKEVEGLGASTAAKVLEFGGSGTMAELEEALAAQADIVMLDNMDDESVRVAVARCREDGAPPRGPIVEASGGITLERIPRLAAAGVDVISVGALTHSAPAADISLEFVPA